MRKPALHPCPEYHAAIDKLGPRDLGWVAVLYGVTWAYLLWLGDWHLHHPVGMWGTLWLTLPELVVVSLLVAAALRRRRQGLDTIGLASPHARKSLAVGVTIAGVVLAAARIIGFLGGGPRALTAGQWTYLFAYYLVAIAFCEELVFRGFITTRLAACFERRWMGVVLAGALFSLSHIPFQLVMAHWSLAAVAPDLAWELPLTFYWHLVLWWLYARFNHLAAPTFVHLVINMAAQVV